MTVPRPHALIIGALAALLVSSASAAQPLGALTWQMQPYCNRVTFQVVQNGNVFTLTGFDDQCGAGTHTAAAGAASFNPDGTVNLGFSIITPDVGVVHVDATVDLSTLSGPWRDTTFHEGTLAFNGSVPGDPRPSPLAGSHQSGGYHGRSRFGGGYFFATGYNGTLDAPAPMRIHDTLGRFGAGGFNGQSFNWPMGMLDMSAAEDWTPTANGTRMRFWTTEIGSTFASVRMLVDYNGFVGIGTGNARPDDRLHVRGDIRVGDSGTNGCLKNSNGGAIIGTCSSDRRFKRDVVAYENLLSRVAALQPVAFSWRSDAFPERGFGPEREAGLVAQEVERVLPELVTTDAEGFKAVDYSRLPLVAIQAIKELKEKNDALESRLAAIESLLGKW